MAQIIEHATGDVPAVEVDVVTLDIIENALRNARYEMDEVLFRTALSPGIREQHDEFPLIGDPEGKMVAGQFGLSVPALLGRYEGTIEEGDVLLTSDPYACDAAISHANGANSIVRPTRPVAPRTTTVGVRTAASAASEACARSGSASLRRSK